MAVNLSLENKVALITGGSRGIGAACVRIFVDAGAKVIFNYQQAQEAADALVLELGSLNCHAVQADLDGEGAEQMLVEDAVKQYGRLDALVVNHGIWPPKDQPIDQMSAEQWQGTMAVNLDSVFLLVKHSVAR